MYKSLFKFGIQCLMIAISLPCFALETKQNGDPIGTNFPKDAEGRVFHLGIKKGDVANNILIVGDPERAKLIVKLLDSPETVFAYASNRGFVTYTGTKNGKPVSIISTGMGLPMTDFTIREVRAITEGPLSIIRLGSCGTPREDISVGTLVVAKEAFCISARYDAYHQKERSSNVLDYFDLSTPIKPDLALHSSLVAALEKQSSGTFPVVEATNVSTDSFYGSQGRLDPEFDDRNEDLIDTMMSLQPNTGAIEMETHHLFHLAKLSKGSIRAAGCAIVLAQRKANIYLTNAEKHALEVKAGEACLEALLN